MLTTGFFTLFARNLRVSFFIIVAVVGAVVGYALLMEEEAEWFVVIAVAAGMAFSSLFNAWRDSKRKGLESSGE